jgi:hypothetical protein
MPRFRPNPSRPDHLLASIVALTEQANTLALDSAMDTARADADGNVNAVVEHVCRLAVGTGVTAGEVAWLVSELESAGADGDQRASAYSSIESMGHCIRTVAGAVHGIVERGAPAEVAAAAEALRRVADQLETLLGRLQPA